MGEKFTWFGAFVAWVSTAILFYYSVVVGWCIKYIISTIFNYKDLQKAESFWLNFTSGYQPLILHAISILLGGFVILSGISSGIERVNKILIPSLFLILIAGVIRSLTLPGASTGLDFLFSPDFSLLKDYNVWLNALSQAAWSTGAGWGLILTYAVYMGKREDTFLTSTTIAFGDYSASLLAGMTVVPTLFYALGMNERALSDVLKSSNQGLTFISVPSLFHKIPMGNVVLLVFFVALFMAAFTSLLSLIELPTRILMDAGFTRKRSVLMVVIASFLMGGHMRHRSIDSIVHYAELGKRIGLRILRFISPSAFAYGSIDGCTVNFDTLEAMLKAVSVIYGKTQVYLGSFPSEVRPDQVTSETLAFVKTYCANQNLVIGAQSGSEILLQVLHRGHGVAEIIRATELTLAAGLTPNVDFIFGLPGETQKDREATLALMQRLTNLGARIHGHTFMPLVGTPLSESNPGRVDEQTRRFLERLQGKRLEHGRWKHQEFLARATVAFIE